MASNSQNISEPGDEDSGPSLAVSKLAIADEGETHIKYVRLGFFRNPPDHWLTPGRGIFDRHSNRFIATTRILDTESIIPEPVLAQGSDDEPSYWVNQENPENEDSYQELISKLGESAAFGHQPKVGLGLLIEAALSLNQRDRDILVHALGYEGTRIGQGPQVVSIPPMSYAQAAGGSSCPPPPPPVMVVAPPPSSGAVGGPVPIRDPDSAYTLTKRGKSVLIGDSGDPNIGYHRDGKFLGMPLSVTTDRCARAVLAKPRSNGISKLYWDTNVWYWNAKTGKPQRKPNAPSNAQEARIAAQIRTAKSDLQIATSAFGAAAGEYNTDMESAQKGLTMAGEPLPNSGLCVLNPLIKGVLDARATVVALQSKMTDAKKASSSGGSSSKQ